MTRVLLTGKSNAPPYPASPLTSNNIIFTIGGSGFIAAHVLDILLEHGHTVVTTVRSEEKAQKIRDAHPDTPTSKLDFRIVEDIAQEDAFDEAVKIEGLEAVIHTASPVCFSVPAAPKRRSA
jgi:nucleoside-diphosphate-sugar epimerase